MLEKDFAKDGDKVLSPVLGHYTRLSVTHGQGSYLYGTDGQAYLDFAAGIAVASTGHCHPTVVKAIQDQAATLIHACAGVVYYGPHIQLAERIGSLLGHNLSSVFYCQSGTEAIEAALKLAKYVTGKSDVVAFKGGFHGRTMGSLSITSSKDKYRDGYGELVPGARFFPYPYHFRSPWDSSPEDFDAIACQHLDEFFSDLPDSVACVVIEPILGEGGYVPAPHAFLKRLRELCTEKGILLIFDEIQSGFGRTGEWFAFHKSGIVPDIVTLAKGIASGLPLGACVASPDLMNKWKTGAHGGTYGGNPVTCRAALATIDVIHDHISHIPALSKLVFSTLNNALASHPNVGDIRGEGLMIGIELVKDKQGNDPYPDMVKNVMTQCLDQKLIIVSCGIHDNVIRLMPPLTINEDDLKHGLNTLISVLNDAAH